METLENNNLELFERITASNDYLLSMTPHETEIISTYRTWRMITDALETEIDKTEIDHAFRMLPMEEMKDNMRFTCLDAIMVNPMTDAAKKIQAARDESNQMETNQTALKKTQKRNRRRAHKKTQV